VAARFENAAAPGSITPARPVKTRSSGIYRALKLEISMIQQMKFSGYFLIVWISSDFRSSEKFP